MMSYIDTCCAARIQHARYHRKIYQPRTTAKIMIIRTTAKMSNKQQAFPLAFFWYALALLSSRSACRVSVADHLIDEAGKVIDA